MVLQSMGMDGFKLHEDCQFTSTWTDW